MTKTPTFGEDNRDQTTFEPFTLQDNRSDEEFPDVRLEFYDFEILEDVIPELEGNEMGELLCDWIEKFDLVKHKEGSYEGGFFDNCESGTCYFHFNHLDDAIRVAEFCIGLIKDKDRLRSMLGPDGDEESEDD